MSTTEEKLVKLYEDLDAQGLNDAKQQMRDDTIFYMSATDAKLPPHNTRITIVSKNQDRPFEDEDGSADEGTEDFRSYRDQIKQASKMLVDSKSKRQQRNKK